VVKAPTNRDQHITQGTATQGTSEFLLAESQPPHNRHTPTLRYPLALLLYSHKLVLITRLIVLEKKQVPGWF